MLIYEYSERRVLMKKRVLIFDVERAGYSVLNDARVLNETYVLSLDSGYKNVFDNDANVLL